MDRQNLLASVDKEEDGDYAKVQFFREPEEHEPEGPRRSLSLRRKLLSSWLPWSIHLVAFLIYGASFTLRLEKTNDSCPRLTSKSWPDIYGDFSHREVVWSTHRYKFEGDHTTRIGDPGWEETLEHSEYEGRPTAKGDQAWADLIQLGSVSITEEEKSRLPFDTAKNILRDGEYVVGLQVFHQLHCLFSLRHQVWNPVVFKWKNGEERSWWEFHMDHCLEALRESIVCNADMAPLRYIWDELESAYLLTLPQQYKCKSWDNVWDWASSRNTTGDCPRNKLEVDEPMVCPFKHRHGSAEHHAGS